MTPFIAELIGTMILVLLGNGVVANVVLKGTKGNSSGWIVITTAWALAVFVGVLIAGPYSGAHLNPIVTIALAITGKFAWASVGSYVLAQMIGGMVGALLVWIFYKDYYAGTEDKGGKLATFCTGPAIRNYSSNFISEAIATFILIISVFYITGANMLHPVDLTNPNSVAAPIPVGLGTVGAIPIAFVVWVLGLSLGGTTGYALNPARDLSPRIMHAILPVAGKGDSDWSYSWIPVLGPLTGGVLASLLYIFLSGLNLS